MFSGYFPLDPRFYLKEELEQRKKRRPQYSLRAFARDLELSPSFLCEFLAGRNGMSKDRVIWVSKKIKLADEQLTHFWDLVEAEFGRTEDDRNAAKLRASTRAKDSENHLCVDKFKMMADWYHLTLLELFDLPGIHLSNQEMATILGIELEELLAAIERLNKLGLIQWENEKSKYEVCTENTVAGGEGAQRAVQLSHQQFLKMQSEMTAEKTVKDRESLSISFGVKNEDWENFRLDLRQAIISVVSKYGAHTTENDQVVCLGAQAFRLLAPQEQRGKSENS